jgi:hypothetical protein
MGALANTVEIDVGGSGYNSVLADQLYRVHSCRQADVIRSEIGVDFWLGENGGGLVWPGRASVSLYVVNFALCRGKIARL